MRLPQLLLACLVIGLSTVAGKPPAALAQTPGEPPLDTTYQTYEKPLSLPFGLGLRIPSYNRVDGIAIPWGPRILLADGNVVIDPIVTYRSHIGEIDPALNARLRFGAYQLEAFGGRNTFTNDKWIRSDLMNSLSAIGVGTDARNYFRADRGSARISYETGNLNLRVIPWVGGLHERAWSTGSPTEPDGGPWSLFGRTDSLKMRRPNPAIIPGHTTSALAGIELRYDTDSLKASFDADVEHAFDSPSDDEDFTQITFDSRAGFPTFGMHTFEFRGHAVFSSGSPPPQRFVYLGGGGTLATLDLLALGGDRLLFVEGEYLIPLKAPVLPFVGAPVISFRYAAGSAGIDELPDFVQNIGVGVGVKLIKAQYHYDPSFKDTPYSKRSAFSIGFSLSF